MKSVVCFLVLTLTVLAQIQAAHAEVLRWEYSGRIVDVTDPDDQLIGLRPGDPVEGHIQFDTTMEIGDFNGLGVTLMDEEEDIVDFEGISMRATNPRTGEIFQPLPAFDFLSGLMIILAEDPFGEGVVMDLYQDTVTAEGTAAEPSMSVIYNHVGDEPGFDSSSLPTQLSISDDSLAVFRYGEDDPSDEGELPTEFSGAIFELTPVDLLRGDFDIDFDITPGDIDNITQAIRFGSANEFYDLNGDLTVDEGDRQAWIQDVANSRPGDTNLDGDVDFEDFLVLSQNFGTPGTWATGNFDIDPEVTFADFLILSHNFGEGANGAAVPEPANTLIWLFLLPLLRRVNSRS